MVIIMSWLLFEILIQQIVDTVTEFRKTCVVIDFRPRIYQTR